MSEWVEVWFWAGAIWMGAAVVVGLIAGRIMALSHPIPQPPDRRFWNRRQQS
jgi:hypothetical protein